MHIESDQVYKHLTSIAKITGLVPIIITIGAMVKIHYQTEQLPFQIIAGIVVGYLGYLLVYIKTRIQYKFSESSFIQILLIALGYFISIALICLFILRFVPYTVGSKIIFFGVCMAIFFISIADYSKPYFHILTVENLVFISIIYILGILISKIGYLGLIYILIVGIYIFNNNQSSIDHLLDQTKANTPMSRNIKRDNMKWVCLLMSFILIAYPLRKHLAKVILKILAGINYVILMIIRAMVNFVSWLLEGGELDRQYEEAKQFDMEVGTGHSITSRAFTAFFIGIILLFLIKNRKAIISGIASGIRKVAQLIKRFYHFLFDKEEKAIKHEYYMETVESIDGDIELNTNKQVHLDSYKWRRKVKKYLKQLSPNSSYREGYQLVLQGAKLKGIAIPISKTPRELIDEIQRHITLHELQEGTMIYEKTRYDEQVATMGEISTIANILKELLV